MLAKVTKYERDKVLMNFAGQNYVSSCPSYTLAESQIHCWGPWGRQPLASLAENPSAFGSTAGENGLVL